jgi:hypothetical protein
MQLPQSGELMEPAPGKNSVRDEVLTYDRRVTYSAGRPPVRE